MCHQLFFDSDLIKTKRRTNSETTSTQYYLAVGYGILRWRLPLVMGRQYNSQLIQSEMMLIKDISQI